MWFFGLIVVLLIGAVAVVASGRWGAMSPAYDDRPDMTVPARQALTSTEIESVRFAVGLRGYRMDEVDTLLERVAREVAERDRRIADLERAVAPILDSPDGDGFASRNRYTAADFDDTGSQEPILVGGDFPPAEQTTASEEPPAAPTPTPMPAPVAAAPGVTLPVVAVPAAPSPAEPQQPAADPAPAAAEPAPQPVAEAAAQPESTPQAVAEEPPATAANEYERLQAEARALLEATTGSLPTIRTTDKPATPAAPPQVPDARATPADQPPAGSWFQEPPAPQQFQGQDQSGAAYPQPTQPTPYQQPTQQSAGQATPYRQDAPANQEADQAQFTLRPSERQQTPQPTQQSAAQPSPYQQPPSQPTPYQQPAQAPQQQAAPVPHWVQPQVAQEQANGGAEAPPEGWEAWEPPSGDPGAQGRHSAPPDQPAYRRPS
ncbi:DivIVA domain-containing protein [Kribbella sp. NPDC051587]|uniref:DivIVA domain-containing protein n=1 Tax=Kribbella sp. NPDC051587 TaxID=3364119 RepID=UPI0037AD5034